MKSLKERFAKEIDFDGAMYELGAMLGFWPEINNWQNREEWLQFNDRKWIFWSNNPVGNHLGRMLIELVDMGALIKCDKGDGFIANPTFDPSSTDNK